MTDEAKKHETEAAAPTEGELESPVLADIRKLFEEALKASPADRARIREFAENFIHQAQAKHGEGEVEEFV